MPYAFAHPAAVIPVARLLGGRAVPSALAIGSVVPDAWYFVPGLVRSHSHDGLGVLWFCLPAGLVAYAAFHLIFKQPMLALLPRGIAARAAAWTPPGLPAARWPAVLLSLLVGIATHVAWDALTHDGGFTDDVLQLLQHGSTLLGTAFLGWWGWRKLWAAQPRAVPVVEPRVRLAVLAAMAIVPALAFAAMLTAFEPAAYRLALRAGGVTALSVLGLVALSFSLAWRSASRSRGKH